MFSASWLDRREAVDHASRSAEVTGFVTETLGTKRGVRVLDLGAGTGSNLRYLIDRVPGDQRWTLVDHDRALLAGIPERVGVPAGEDGLTLLGGRCHVSWRERDLRTLDPVLFEAVDLVTAAALLDLVSEPWIETLAEYCRAAGAAALFALTYDGRVECTPVDPDDGMVVALVNRHQRTDKGFGPAAGPGGPSAAARSFARAGYELRRDRSDWMLGPGQAELQRQLIAGWMDAAAAIDPSGSGRVHAWGGRRLDHVTAGVSQIRVGHEDLGCLPRR